MTAEAGSSPGRPGSRSIKSDEVLLAKITAPSLPGWIVRRTRVEQRITAGTAGPLTVVTGPPGAGKTMAAASWAAVARGPVAWVALDRYDSRPSVFWATVGQALREAGVTFRGPPPGRGSEGHVFLHRLAAELAAQQPPVVLVMDDFHLVTGTAVTDGLQYLMRNARPGLRVVACSRADPAMSLHRYRLAGELTEIRAGELAFTAPEAGLLLAQHGITLPDGPLERLTTVHEGWAAGLRMAALSLREQPDPERFIREFGAEDSAIAAYLVAEVLDTQPARSRNLLLKTSILGRVSAGIAGELADEERAAGILEELAAAHTLVEPLGNGWYRYHAMFAEVLRQKLSRKYPGQVAGLHRRAACWYAASQQLPDAVRHAVAAGDLAMAARLVIDDLAIGVVLEAGDHDPIGECLRRMPRITAESGPHLALAAAAVALHDDRQEAGRAALAIADELLTRVPAEQELPCRVAAETIRLDLARRTGDRASASTSAGALEELAGLLPADTAARHPQLGRQLRAARAVLGFWAGLPWSGHSGTGADPGGPAVAPGTPQPDHADCCGYLALLDALQGRPRAAEQVSRAADLDRDGLAGAGQRPGAAAEIALARTHLDRNELREAREQLERADAALRARPDKLAGAAAHLVAACYHLADSHASDAAKLISRARQGWSPPSWLDHQLTVLESRAFAATDDIASAVAAAQRAHPEVSLDAAVALAQAWLDDGDLQSAAGALKRAPALTGDAADGLRVDWWLVDARLAYASDDLPRGRQSLRKALRLGQRERIRLPFAMAAAWIRPVLRRDPELAEAHRALLSAGHDGRGSHASTRAPARTSPAPLIVEQLSGRERQVLVLIARMLSTEEVANELFISVNTVKTHVKSIHRKLSATHRSEAVRRARELELI